MCLSNNRGTPAHFSKTILAGFEVLNAAGEVEHVAGYKNNVGEKAAAPVRTGGRRNGGFGYDVPKSAVKVVHARGNSMILAVPARAGTITLIPVGTMPNLMDDYRRAITPPSNTRRSLRGAKGLDFSVPQVISDFDGGLYDVVISPSASQIASVIDQVKEEKRPEINELLYAELDVLNGADFQYLLYCFPADAVAAGCALVKYQPHKKWEHLLHLPGLDGHSGKIERGMVDVDHSLIVGSYLMPESVGTKVHFTDLARDKMPAGLLDRVVGKTVTGEMMQGDFQFDLREVRKGNFVGQRALPQHWAKLEPKYDKKLDHAAL